jgi:cell division protein FtsA
MAKDIILAGIDIGTQKIRTVVSLLDEETQKPHIIGMSIKNSQGVRKGAVVDVNEVITLVSESLAEAERMSGVPLYSACISVGGTHLSGMNSKGVVAINRGEITEYDIERVLEAAQAVSTPQNLRILRVIPKEYQVDGMEGIKNPIGMVGTRLEAEAHIIFGQKQAVSHLEKCIHQAGLGIQDLVPSPLAVSEAVLSKRQKELGVLSIDIGASSTTLAVYEEGVVLHTAVLPIGGASVTNDIAIGLRTSIDTAEKIKIEYGSTSAEDISDRDLIDLSLLSKIDSHKVSKKELSNIIQARYQEIFHLILQELKRIGRDGMLPAGAVLTGGAIKMPGTLDIARETLSLPVQIGFPQNITGVVEKIDDPSFATVIGLIHWGAKYDSDFSSGGGFSLNIGKNLSGIVSWFKNLLP